VLSTIGWLAQGLMLVSKLGLMTLIRNIWVLQGEFQVQFVGYLNMIGILVLPAFVLRLAVGSVKKTDFILVLASLFGLLLAGIKGGMAVILVFFIFYAAKVDIFAKEFYAGTGLMKHLPALHMPYLYFVGSWPSLGFIIDGTVADLPHLGTFVLQPMWKILGAIGVIEYDHLSQPFVSIGKFTFNVYSLVGEVYWDLKWPGVLGVSFLLGVINTRLYLRIRSSDYWGHILIYAVVVHGLFVSFFSFIYTFNVYVLVLYIFLVGFVLPRGGVLIRSEKPLDGEPGRGT